MSFCVCHMLPSYPSAFFSSCTSPSSVSRLLRCCLRTCARSSWGWSCSLCAVVCWVAHYLSTSFEYTQPSARPTSLRASIWSSAWHISIRSPVISEPHCKSNTGCDTDTPRPQYHSNCETWLCHQAHWGGATYNHGQSWWNLDQQWLCMCCWTFNTYLGGCTPWGGLLYTLLPWGEHPCALWLPVLTTAAGPYLFLGTLPHSTSATYLCLHPSSAHCPSACRASSPMRSSWPVPQNDS